MTSPSSCDTSEPPDGDLAGLPTFSTSFIGREVEMDTVDGLLATAQLVTITGTGGSGKTRLADRVARDRRHRHADGIVWVDLTRLVDDAGVASEVAAACGLAQSPAGVTPQQMVEQHLAARDRLVVLDNAEHVVDGVAAFADRVVANRGRSVLLVTSRESLGIGHEVVWRIPPMGLAPDGPDAAGADRADADGAVATGAVELFCQRARAVRPEAVPGPDEMPVVAALCRRLDGMPLAVELAARELRSRSLVELVDALDDRLRGTTSGPRARDRHRTLHASIGWSYELLDEPTRAVLRHVSVFIGSFTVADAEATVAHPSLSSTEVGDRLGALVDKGLLQRAAGGYAMLESIRPHAVERCSEAGELEGLRDRHFRRMGELAEEWGFGRRMATAATLAEADGRIANLRTALRWGASTDRDAAAVLVVALAHVLATDSRYDDINQLVQGFLADVPERSPAWCDVVAASMDSLSMGAEWWRTGAADALDDPDLVLDGPVRRRLLAGLALPGLMAGTPGVADHLGSLIDEARDDRDMAFAVGTSVTVALYLAHNGNLRRAATHLAWAERHLTDAPRITSQARGARTMIAAYRCDVPAVTAAITEAVAVPKLDPTETLAAVIGAMFSGQRDLVDAVIDRCRRMEFSGSVAFVPTWVDLTQAVMDQDIGAARHHVEAILGQPVVASRQAVHMVAADVVLAAGDVEAARAHSQDAFALLDGLDCPYVLAMTTQTAAQIDRLDGAVDRAIERIHVALDLATGHGLRSSHVNVLENLGVIRFHAGNAREAGRTLGACAAFREAEHVGMRVPYLVAMIDECREGSDPEWWDEGATLSLDDITDHVRRGRGARGRPTAGWEALTPSEEKVVALVADGLTNQEVADALFVGVETVKTHLKHVFQKVGVRNRTRLVGAWNDHDAGSSGS